MRTFDLLLLLEIILNHSNVSAYIMRLADVLDYSFALVILIVWFLSRKTDKLIVVGNLLKIVLNYE